LKKKDFADKTGHVLQGHLHSPIFFGRCNVPAKVVKRI